MKDIRQYILLPKDERQRHLKLSESCVYRGGAPNWASVHCRGLLAFVLDTTIPTGHKIHLCHACHNGECCNPFHLYWGTAAENRADASVVHPDSSPWQRIVKKYGIAKAREMAVQSGRTGGKIGGHRSRSSIGRVAVSKTDLKRAPDVNPVVEGSTPSGSAKLYQV